MKSPAIPLLAAVAMPATVLAQVTLTPLTTFGGGDGWLAPGEGGYTFLGTGTLERGIGYGNGHLYLVSRSGGTSVRILNPDTGADLGGLNVTGVSGGTFAANMVGVGGDGAIYAGNLTTSAASPFKVYRWADESAIPTVAYDASPGLPRVGDSFAVTGSGTGTTIVASGTGSIGFASINPLAGTGAAVPVAGTAAGAYRIGLTFVDDNTVIGTQGGSWMLTDFSGTSGTLVSSISTPSATERLLAYNVVGGLPLLATTDTTSSLVRLYDMSNPTSPVLLASANNTSGALSPNGTGVGSMAWGSITGNSATLYALNANQGIQAFTVTVVPEPGPLVLTALGLAALVLFRRNV